MTKRLLESLLLMTSMFAASVFADRLGIEYQSEDIQVIQADDFQNPGMLAVDAGRVLANTALGQAQKSCMDCHEGFESVATEFPKFNERLEKLVSLTGQIKACHEDFQGAAPVDYESEQVQQLSTFVASRSRGLPFSEVPASLAAAVQRGKDYYYQRKGQLNLSCAQCHEDNAGKYLRGDKISQGVSTGYPIYRLEWQRVGSLHRRFRACDIGVRAEPDILGGQVYTELELYLRVRAGALPITAPAVRR